MSENKDKLLNNEIIDEELGQVAGGMEDIFAEANRQVIPCRVNCAEEGVALQDAPRTIAFAVIRKLGNNEIFEAYPNMFDHTGNFAFGRDPKTGIEGWVNRNHLYTQDGGKY